MAAFEQTLTGQLSDFMTSEDCDVLVRELSGRPIFSSNVSDCTSFTTYARYVLQELQGAESRKLTLPLEVVEMITSIHWQNPIWQQSVIWNQSPSRRQSITGTFVIQALTLKQYETLIEKFELAETDANCHVCFSSCTDADDVFSNTSRVQNCVRCLPCFLCPYCKVLVDGTPVCYHCLEDVDFTLLNGLSDVRQKRIAVLALPDEDDT